MYIAIHHTGRRIRPQIAQVKTHECFDRHSLARLSFDIAGIWLGDRVGPISSRLPFGERVLPFTLLLCVSSSCFQKHTNMY